MGRSPAFSTRTFTATRPAFNSMEPGSRKYSPGCMPRRRLTDGIVDGNELGAVREGAFDLDFANHLRHPLHHVGARQDVRAEVHQLRDRSAVPDALEDLG